MREGDPIFGFNQHRGELVEQTVERVVARTADPLLALNDAAYHETRRLDKSKHPGDLLKLESWRQLARHVGKMSPAERREKLREIVTEYAKDIAGNFDPRVFKFTTRLLPSLVTTLFSPKRLPGLLRAPSRLLSLEALSDKVAVAGEIEALRSLAKRGTLIFMPTHSSNMDSIVFGTGLELAGLPPATYGAGKNLFTNPILSFFMHNLGAYKVDRRLRHQLYKDALKAYSTVLIEHGYHSLFFPGGTRSRSGGVERKLKLGLMGTGVEAYVNTLLRGRERRVFFVPCTINYLLTLEAETLIEDHLSEAGKARYIIEDDESSRISRFVTFVRKALAMDHACIIRFGAPLDPFGSAVDAEGRSHDRRGRVVEPASYVRDLSGNVRADAARDAQYTRELAQEICRAFRRETVAMSTSIVAAACFEQLRQQAPGSDLFAMLRLRDVIVQRDELARTVLRLRDHLLDLEHSGDIVLSDQVRSCSGGDIVAQAMRAFSGYHSSPVIEPGPQGVMLHDTNLLYYYQNRLAAHGVSYDHGQQARTAELWQ